MSKERRMSKEVQKYCGEERRDYPALSYLSFYLSAFSLSPALPLLKWQQTPPTLGGQAHFFVCLEKARPGIVTVDDPMSSTLTSPYHSLFIDETTHTNRPALLRSAG